MSDALKDRLSQAMHEGLAGVSRSYAALASSRRIGKPKVVLLKQGTFRVFREKGKRLLGPYGAQMKTVRVLRKPEVVNFFTQQEDGEE